MKTILSVATVILLTGLGGFSADILPPPGSSPGSPSDHPFPPGERTPQNDWPTNMVHPHTGITTNMPVPEITNSSPNETNYWSTNNPPGTNGHWARTWTNRNPNPPSEIH